MSSSPRSPSPWTEDSIDVDHSEHSGWAGHSDAEPLALTALSNRYREVSLVGRGGMGQVVIAHDTVLDRQVALKVVRPDRLQSPDAAARLAQEARITASLDHPAIVPVHDAGRTPDGAPFYVMRLVRGRPLSVVLAETAADARLTHLRHVLAVVEAIAYAHHRGVVHRDLKPDNIMLGEFGEVQVMDWGLAASSGTHEGAPVGTTAYMSPEQSRGDPVTDRSDVWSLGVLLLDLVDPVATSAPRPPVQTRLAALASPPDLKAIIARCLPEEPAQRYSARELGDELARFLDGRRVKAYDYPLGALVKRVILRWRIPIAIGTLAIVALVTILLVSRGQIQAERDQALLNLSRILEIQAIDHFRDDALFEAEAFANCAIEALTATPSSAVTPDVVGVLMARHSRPHLDLAIPLPNGCTIARVDGSHLLCLSAGLASLYRFELDELVSLGDAAGTLTPTWTIPSRSNSGQVLAATNRVALVEPDGTLQLVDLATGASTGSAAWQRSDLLPTSRRPLAFNASSVFSHLDGDALRPPPCTGRLISLAASPDETRWVGSCTDGTLGVAPIEPLVRDSAPPTVLRFDPASPTEGPSALAFLGPDKLAWGNPRGDFGLVSIAAASPASPATTTTHLWRREAAHAVRAVATSPDLLAFALEEGYVRLVSHDGHDLATLPARTVTHGLRFEAGKLITVSDALRVWSFPHRHVHRLALAEGLGLTGAVPSPDGTRLAASFADGRVAIVTTDGDPVAVYRPLTELVKPVAWTPDAASLLGTWMNHASLQRLDLADGSTRTLGAGAFRRAAFLAPPPGSPHHEIAVGIGFANNSGLWLDGVPADLDDINAPDLLTAEAFLDLATSHDQRCAVLTSETSPALVVLSSQSTQPPVMATRLTLSAPARAVDISNDGVTVALARASGVALIDFEAPNHERPFATSGANVLDLAFTPDTRHLIGGADDGTVLIWRVDSGELAARIHAHHERVAHVEAPSNGLAVSTSWDGTTRLWDLTPLDLSRASLLSRLSSWGLASTLPCATP